MKELTINELSWIVLAATGVIAVILFTITSILSRIATALERIAQNHPVDYSDALTDMSKAISKPCDDCGADNSPFYPDLNGRYCEECHSRQG